MEHKISLFVFWLFCLCRSTFIWITSEVVQLASELTVSMRRLKQFLLISEISNNELVAPNFDDKLAFVANTDAVNTNTTVVSFDPNCSNNDNSNNDDTGNGKIEMKNASFSWDLMPYTTLKRKLTSKNIDNTSKNNYNNEKSKLVDEPEMRHELSNITIKIENNQFYAIVGPIGSGKSSLLLAIAGELPLKQSVHDNKDLNESAPNGCSVNVNGTIGYASQKSWIFNGSVRDNILFGNQFNDAWYKRVIHACALIDDLKIFPNADFTIIGERGINLSGGQKGICLL